MKVFIFGMKKSKRCGKRDDDGKIQDQFCTEYFLYMLFFFSFANIFNKVYLLKSAFIQTCFLTNFHLAPARGSNHAAKISNKNKFKL